MKLISGLLIFKLIAPVFKQALFHLVAICTHEHKAFYKSLKSHFKIPTLTYSLHSVLCNLQDKGKES